MKQDEVQHRTHTPPNINFGDFGKWLPFCSLVLEAANAGTDVEG